MKVVVTGGSGKLGRYLVPKLAEEHQVIVYDLNPLEHKSARGRSASRQRTGLEQTSGSPQATKKRSASGGQVNFLSGDICEFSSCQKSFLGADAVVHLAALRSIYNNQPERVMKVNIMGTFNALEAAAQAGIRKFIFASSDALLGFSQRHKYFSPEYLPIDEAHPCQPQDPYGLSKLLGEEICLRYIRRFQMKLICLRASNIFYPGDETLYASQAYEPETRQRFLWNYVHVSDLVEAYLAALKALDTVTGKFFICADDICLLKGDIQELIQRFYPGIPKVAPDLTGRRSLIDCSRAKTLLGYQPQRTFPEIIAPVLSKD